MPPKIILAEPPFCLSVFIRVHPWFNFFRRVFQRALQPILLVSLFISTLAARAQDQPADLAAFAKPVTSYVSGNETLDAINNGTEPANSADHRNGAYGNWPKTGTQWVEYDWANPVSTDKIDVYWWRDGQGINLPSACRVLYWDGASFKEAASEKGLGISPDQYNTTTFQEITTSKLRLEFTGQGTFSTGILQWKVYDSGKSPKFPPKVAAGADRAVILQGKAYLKGFVQQGANDIVWNKVSGPGDVAFENPNAAATSARFSMPGDYALKLSATEYGLSGSGTMQVRVVPAPPATPLQPVYTSRYTIDSPLWSGRLKQVIIHWIPHCIAELSDPGLKEGGIQNFIEADKKNAGQASTFHVGPPWADAYVLNTVESMCWALMFDPRGDKEIIQAQSALQAKLDEWIPILLAAQEKDGYLQTRFTLGTEKEHGHPAAHWTLRGDHEGYVAGYFIDAAIADYQLTGGRDRRLYDAALRLADCWDKNVGPGSGKKWFDGHENIEQALVRLGRFRNELDGTDTGASYIELAKYLLDNRSGGRAYDQSQRPLVQQSEAVGHAVRAVYCYTAMEDVGMEMGDVDYQSAALSIWSNLVNKKYYVTGGVGSGETPEGFGPDYSLPNNAYCESCSGCGELFFQHEMNLAYANADYADLYEETLYNAILGSLDLNAENFTYTNALEGDQARYPWHACPCCVGNIPRTLLMLPEWMYARAPGGLYVNLFIGSTVNISSVAGTDVQVVQKTDYPWHGAVAFTVNPAASKKFTIWLRIPRHDVSPLYHDAPDVAGFTDLRVNGAAMSSNIENGYIAITREWRAGDRIDLTIPMKVQRVKADSRVAADQGRVALRYGPLIYNVESVDQNPHGTLSADAPLSVEWDPALLGGVMVIHGKYVDGSNLEAIPNYSRNNRGGESLVWIKDE